MGDLQGFLAAVSIGIVIFFLLRANDRIKTANIGEIGSFLAGIIAPITVLWIIYGQFSQSEYIKQNSEYIAQQIRENKQKQIPVLHIFSRHLGDSELKNFNDYYENLFLPNHYGDIREFGEKNSLILNSVRDDYNELKNYTTHYSSIEMVITNSGGNAYNISINSNNQKHIAIYKTENKNLLENETKKIKINIPLGYFLRDYEKKIIFTLKLEDIYGEIKKYQIEAFLNTERKQVILLIESAARQIINDPELLEETIYNMRKDSSKYTRAESLDFNIIPLINSSKYGD